MENYGNKNQTKPIVFEIDLSIYVYHRVYIYNYILVTSSMLMVWPYNTGNQMLFNNVFLLLGLTFVFV